MPPGTVVNPGSAGSTFGAAGGSLDLVLPHRVPVKGSCAEGSRKIKFQIGRFGELVPDHRWQEGQNRSNETSRELFPTATKVPIHELIGFGAMNVT